MNLDFNDTIVQLENADLTRIQFAAKPRCATKPRGSGAWALYRPWDCNGPWRHAPGYFHGRGNLLHVPFAGDL